MTASTNSQAARRRAILAAVRAIPPGRVQHYGGVALAAGLPGRARLVGRILAQLDDSEAESTPWHRVVNAAGRSSLDGPAADEQRARLRAEGIRFTPGGAVARAHRLSAGAPETPPRSDDPLLDPAAP